MIVGNQVCMQFGTYMGDASNNEAEYEAFGQAVSHALRHPQPILLFRLDSMLVVKQALGEWACRSAHLVPAYNQIMCMLERLRQHGSVIHIQHVYREFNSDADGIANQVLDASNSRIHGQGGVGCHNWDKLL